MFVWLYANNHDIMWRSFVLIFAFDNLQDKKTSQENTLCKYTPRLLSALLHYGKDLEG